MKTETLEADRKAFLANLKGATKVQLTAIAASALATLVQVTRERDQLKEWQTGVLGHLDNVESFLEKQPEYIDAAVNVAMVKLLPEMVALERTKAAKKAAAQSKLVDPKQHAKAKVRECWEDWKKGKTEYKSASAFALDMLDKGWGLESQQVIQTWCTDWKRKST